MKTHLPYKLLIVLIVLLISSLAVVENVAGDALQCVTGDNRINNQPPRDCGAPVLIYLIGDNIVVLTPSQGTDLGKPILSIDKRTPIPTGSNTVIGQGTNQLSNREVIISRLTTGEYQLNTFYPDGAGYIVVWYAGKSDLYHIDPATGKALDGAGSIIAPDAADPSSGAAAAVPVTVPGTTPALTAAVVAGSESLKNCRVTTTKMVRIRTEPNTNSVVISTLPYRTTYQATDRIEGWYKVIYMDTQGWVSADFLTGSGCD
jgi:SH3 domain-containing protein